MRLEAECFINETEKAVLIKRRGGGELWIPLSVCEKIVRKPMAPPVSGTGKMGWVEVADWWARDKELE